MDIAGFPETFKEWEKMRQEHMSEHLQFSDYTNELFKQYHKHLGMVRYYILLETQTLVAPEQVRKLLGFRKLSLLHFFILPYRWSRRLKVDQLVKALLLPSRYKKEIQTLDSAPV
jgi:hypothetical protein